MAYTRQHSFVPSTYAVVRLEPLDALAKLCADMVHDYQPVNSEELFAVERMALTRFAMLRADRLVIGMHTASLNEAMDESERPMRLFEAGMIDDIDVTIQQNRSFLLAEGMARINAKSAKDWPLVLRMQVQAERLYRRAVEDYNRIRALRGTDLPDDGVIAPDPGKPVLDIESHVPDPPATPADAPVTPPEPHPAPDPEPEPPASAHSAPPPRAHSTPSRKPAPKPDPEPASEPAVQPSDREPAPPPRSNSSRKPAPPPPTAPDDR